MFYINKKSFFTLLAFIFILLGTFGFISRNVLAIETGAGNVGGGGGSTGTGAANTGKEVILLTNPLTNAEGPEGPISTADLFSRIILGLQMVTGTLSFVAFIIGGVWWLTSGGNPEQVKRGRDIFIYATIGLVVVFSSYVVLAFVIRTLTTLSP